MRGYVKCAEPGCDRYFPPKSSRNRFCLKHRKTKPSAVARGTVKCSRCGELIDPRASWDLDHVDDGGPMDYYGPSHARCNRATNRRDADRPLDPSSRIW